MRLRKIKKFLRLNGISKAYKAAEAELGIEIDTNICKLWYEKFIDIYANKKQSCCLK